MYSQRALWGICILTIAGSISCAPQPREGRTSFKALAQAYKEAHEAKDVDALLSLVAFGDGPVAALNRRDFKRWFEHSLCGNIKRIAHTRLGREDQEKGTCRCATLEPLGRMEIEWNEPFAFADRPHYFGKRDGVYYIVAAGPGAAEARLKDLSRTLEQRSPEGARRIQGALARWRNDQVDREPVLFRAMLSQEADSSATLALCFLDEDLDDLGFGVEERWVDTDGASQSHSEEYPVFAHYQDLNMVAFRFVPVQIRQGGQRKKVPHWDEYLKGDKLGTRVPLTPSAWRRTLPAVWVSIPEPNKVSSRVYVYDQAGHKSEPIELLYHLRGSRTPPSEP